MGSSTAYGYFGNPPVYERDSGWVAKIESYYKGLGIVDTVFNIAEAGTDCYSGMPSSFVPPTGRNLPMPGANITAALSLDPKPDVIIVNYPTNSYQWLSFAEIINCLQTIKDSANANNIPCYITTTQPRDDFSPNGGERQRLKDLKELIEATFGFWSIDFWTEIVEDPPLIIVPDYSLGDGVHLNPIGHTVLEDKVIEKNIFFLPLAVNFGDFFVRNAPHKILLNWKTIGEYDIEQFVIEKSMDAVHFNAIGNIAGNRNSGQVQYYSSEDIHPAEGNNYYRIGAVSSSNKINYSIVAVAKYKDESQHSSAIYPSYSNTKLSVSFKTNHAEDVLITIADIGSKKLFSKQVTITNNFISPLDISLFPAGNYIITIDWAEKKEVHRFVKY